MGSAVRTPFDIVKQRMQIQGTLQRRTYKNTLDASLQIAKKEGVLSLFSTAHAALLRDAPFAAIYFTTYEIMKDVQRKVTGTSKDEKLGRINNFIGGATAGAVAALCTNPLDVVKTCVPCSYLHFVIAHYSKLVADETQLRPSLPLVSPRSYS